MNQEMLFTPEMPSSPYSATTYPEIYYKLLPFVILAIDQFLANNIIPDQDMLDRISEDIYHDILEMYPDFEDYTRGFEETEEAVPAINLFGSGRGRRFRRRGAFRDLIDILLLTEFFRRKRN